MFGLPQRFHILGAIVLVCTAPVNLNGKNKDSDSESKIPALVLQLASESFIERQAAQNELQRILLSNPDKMMPKIEVLLNQEKSPEAISRLEFLAQSVEFIVSVDSSVFSQITLKSKTWTVQSGRKETPMAPYKVKGKQVEVDSKLDNTATAVFCRRHKAKNATHRMELSFDLKVLKTTGVHPTLSGIGVLLNDDINKAGLLFHEGKIVVYPSNEEYPFDTTDGWHRYRVTAVGSRMELFIDEAEKPALSFRWCRSPLNDTAFRNQFLFGDTTNTTGGHALWRNVKASVYKRKVAPRGLLRRGGR